jgi:hypothetical protein
MAEKIIRSHRARVKQANEYIKNSSERISIFDREAFVEFFLLEDIERLYKIRQSKVSSRKPETKEGIFYQKKQREKIAYLLYMLKSCIEIMFGKISEGRYSDVWKAIHEHALMVAAGREKYLDQLISLTEGMLEEVDKAAFKYSQKMHDKGIFLTALEKTDEDLRTLEGLPSDEEGIGYINDVINPDEAVTPNEKPESRLKPNT